MCKLKPFSYKLRIYCKIKLFVEGLSLQCTTTNMWPPEIFKFGIGGNPEHTIGHTCWHSVRILISLFKKGGRTLFTLLFPTLWARALCK